MLSCKLATAAIQYTFPPVVQQFNVYTPTVVDIVSLRGRNSHVPKKANHGAQPNSSYMRRLKKKAYYNKPKLEGDQ